MVATLHSFTRTIRAEDLERAMARVVLTILSQAHTPGMDLAAKRALAGHAQTVVAGFVDLDRQLGLAPSADLERWLDAFDILDQLAAAELAAQEGVEA